MPVKTEIEATFYPVKVSDLQSKLKELGAVKIQDRTRTFSQQFKIPNGSYNEWVRIRHNGNNVTVAYKNDSEDSLSGTKEVEITVDDFDTAVSLFEALQFEKLRFNEKDREIWKLNDVEIVIDWWPHLEPMCEIEASSEEEVVKMATKLGFHIENAWFGGTGKIYQHVYGQDKQTLILEGIDDLRFDQPNPFE